MKKMLAFAVLASVAMLALAQVSQANCGKFRSCRGGCDSGCGPTTPVEVKYEERKVKVAKHVWKEKDIDVLECRRIVKDEKYTYTVCTPVWKDEKRKVWVCTPTMKEVDHTWTEMVPKKVERKIQCTSYTCERVMVTEKVPVCRTVCVTYVDECGRCCTKRERVTEWCEQTRCVVKRTPVVEERTVWVTICEPVVRTGKRTICENVRSEQDVIVKVCSYEHKQHQGVRQVCEYVTAKVKHKVKYCETVWEDQVIRVAVGGACCSDDCGRGRVGFFRRSSCCN